MISLKMRFQPIHTVSHFDGRTPARFHMVNPSSCDEKNNMRTITLCFHNISQAPLFMMNKLTGAKRRVAGWVAGGCWDYEIDS